MPAAASIRLVGVSLRLVVGHDGEPAMPLPVLCGIGGYVGQWPLRWSPSWNTKCGGVTRTVTVSDWPAWLCACFASSCS
jgi:hypothetical protein